MLQLCLNKGSEEPFQVFVCLFFCLNVGKNGVGEVSIKSRFPGEDHRLDFGHDGSQMSQDGYVTQAGGHKGVECE